MQVRSLNFGDLTYVPADVIRFAEGLPGFPTLKEFILLASEEFHPLQYLQAVNDPPIAFPIIDPRAVKKDYHVALAPEDARQIGATGPEELLVYAIVTIPKEVERTTVNLLAPIILNSRTMSGKQIVLHGSDYPVQYPIWQAETAAETSDK